MATTLRRKKTLANDLIAAERAISRGGTILAVLGIVTALYFGRALFIPLAVAILLTFVLAPLVRFLRRWRLGRVPSVIVGVALAFTLIFGFGVVLGQQLTQVADRLPQYQLNIQQKIKTVRDSATQGKTIQAVADFLKILNREIESKNDPAARTVGAPEQETKAIPVEIHEPPLTPVQVIHHVLDPLLDPLTTAAVIVIFVIFFLLQREDLRDRLIKLAGSHDLRRTTEAINDTARRLSRYFLAQTWLNATFGFIVGAGLALIGVPNPVLWGIVATILRFVPYVGAFIAAAFPIASSVAVDPGWTMMVSTVALFLVVEPLIGQVVEPLVYGRSTGISPVAVVISATFWTWLWGPIGLLLSTPLAVCLGVLGRHIEWLHFVDVMIGDDPPLTPPQSFYQRALAGDYSETVAQAEHFLERAPLIRYYDDVVLQALLLAQIDARHGTLDEQHVAQINEVVRGLLLDLADHSDDLPTEDGKRHPGHGAPEPAPLPVLRAEELPPGWDDGEPVLCIGGPGPFDDLTVAILVQLLEKHGIRARAESDRAVSALNIARVNVDKIRVVCLSYLYLGHSNVHLGYSTRRVRHRIPGARILAGLWCHEQGELVAEDIHREMNDTAVPDHIAFSLRSAVSACIAIARSGGGETTTDSPSIAREQPTAA